MHCWVNLIVILGFLNTSIATIEYSASGYFQNAAVVSDAVECKDIAKNILDSTGNAVDIAVSTLVCMGIVQPHTSGFGGGFLMTIYNKSESLLYFLDAREIAPSKATKNMFKDNPDLSETGGLAVAIPGELAGLFEVHRRFGRLRWNTLFKPHIEMCNNGFSVSSHFEKVIRIILEDVKDGDLKNMFTNPKTGKLFVEGETMTRPDLAKTLEAVSNANSYQDLFNPQNQFFKDFYRELKSTGSIITEDDLINYKPIWRDPIRNKISQELFMYSSPLPGSGPVLAFILNIMKYWNNSLKNKERAVLFYHRLIESYKFAFGQRAHLEDSDDPFVLAKVEKMLNEDEARDIRRLIMNNGTHSNPTVYADRPFKEDKGTAHMNVITEEGDAVSVTSTVNLWFGAKIMLKTSGIILNNQMDNFVVPGEKNFYGIETTASQNLIVPGRRPISSMVPSIVLDKYGDVKLAIGAVGGTRITTSLAYIILLNQFMGYELNDAIDMPRVHHQLTPNEIQIDANFPVDILDALTKLNHTIGKEISNLAVHGIERTKFDLLHGVSDYRKKGCVVGN